MAPNSPLSPLTETSRLKRVIRVKNFECIFFRTVIGKYELEWYHGETDIFVSRDDGLLAVILEAEIFFGKFQVTGCLRQNQKSHKNNSRRI